MLFRVGSLKLLLGLLGNKINNFGLRVFGVDLNVYIAQAAANCKVNGLLYQNDAIHSICIVVQTNLKVSRLFWCDENRFVDTYTQLH